MKLNKKKPTVKEIAEITGFSAATVSLALNNKGAISEKTRKTVLKAAEKLQYTRPAAAGSSSSFIRLLIEESTKSVLSDPFNGEIIRAIEQECRATGYELILTFVHPSSSPESWITDASGLLLLGSGLITDQLLMKLKHANVPVILVDNYTHEGCFTSVHADHYGAGYQATRYLMERGHTRIGYISGPSRYKTLTDRFAGYCSALIEYGLPMNMHYVSPNFDKKHQKGYLEMKYLMELPDRPSAVFACSDKAALGALDALADMGLKLKDDVELIGCDNIEELKHKAPGLPTVDMPKWQVGLQAVRTMIEAINGNHYTAKIVIPSMLVTQGAVGDHAPA